MKISTWRTVPVTLAFIGFFGSSAKAQTFLSLDSCYRLAYERNKEIAVARHEILAAGHKIQEVGVNFFPQLNLYGGVVRFGKDLQLVNYDKLLGPLSPLLPSMIKDKTKVDMSNLQFAAVSAVQPLFVGGKIIAGMQMAQEAKCLREAMLESTEADVYSAVDEAYWQVVALSSKSRLSKAYLSLLSDAAKDVDLLVEQGIATKVDALAVKVKQSEAEVMLTRIEHGLMLSRMLLAQRCGLDAGEAVYVEDERTDRLPNQSKDCQVSTASLSELAERRAEIRTLKSAEKIYALERKMQSADMLPHIALIGGYTVSSPNKWASLDKLGGTYHVGLVMQLPLTGLISGVFKHREATEKLLIRKLETDDARRKIHLQINQCQLKLDQAQKQLLSSQLNKDNADENLRYAQIAYKEGVVPLINLTQAQTAWQQAADALIEAQIASQMAKAAYRRAIGILPRIN
ncbi:MAG: TolC family protein [Porphyromonas sp.]|nr:TolC family protein [Porphyromonas sp.]